MVRRRNDACTEAVTAPASPGARSPHSGAMWATSNDARRDVGAAECRSIFKTDHQVLANLGGFGVCLDGLRDIGEAGRTVAEG